MLLLAILDGWGYRKEKDGNAIAYACTPNMDFFMDNYPFTFLKAGGADVGLPSGQIGNSEVGHINIGAGRIVYQDSMRISKAIEDKSFFENIVLKKAMRKARDKALHLMGLIGPGGVHAVPQHLYALLEMAKNEGVKNVYIHCFTDGRDTPPKIAAKHIIELEKKIGDIGIGDIVSIVGRYYAMDRDKRWDRTKKAYEMLTEGKGREAKNAEDAVKKAYENGESDEFIKPMVIKDKKIMDGDVVIFFNFRPDRARQLTTAFVKDGFNGFPRKKLNVHFVTLTKYMDGLDAEASFDKIPLENTFGEVISRHGLRQLRIAETEKYAHVTFFFNGGQEKPFKKEDRCLIPSPKVATYDMKPEMSAYELTDELIKRIHSEKYDVIIVNYANPDMVGHTGMWEATVKAVETVDECIGMVIDEIRKEKGMAIITADHGNAEEMIENGKLKTAHTTNPVSFILIGAGNVRLRKGNLGDITPTMLELLGIKKPKEMTGKSLIGERF
ncbi:MAG: 2,3-bisphosphoglycerate-independent phosphoglycerate mutase [Candidatus Thermoplasmatota archaeon]|nr:2,3-bisphosphoglycerate-independent phosphoglycerate mutase [Candidatus Thermoplasmatota archaeon]